jgi:hypothetical protein
MLRIPCRQQQPGVWQEHHCPSTISSMPSIQHSGAGPASAHQQEHLARRALARSLLVCEEFSLMDQLKLSRLT